MHHDNLKCAYSLLTSGADANCLNRKYATFLLRNVDNYECIELLIQTEADVNIRNSLGEIHLIRAAYCGQVQLMDLLIKKGADVNLPDKIGSTPLIYSSLLGHYKCVDLLINSGADVNVVNQGISALGRAVLGWNSVRESLCYCSLDNCVELLLEARANGNGISCNIGNRNLPTWAVMIGRDRCV